MSRIRKSPHPFEHFEVDLLNAGDAELTQIGKTLGLGLSLVELRYIRDHYIVRERKTTDVELQTYDQTFSEHCSHKTFRGVVETRDGRVDGLLKTYIRSVVDEIRPDWCYNVFEDNAGIVDLEGDYKVAIKVETHNHPSAIEPFGGAATGLAVAGRRPGAPPHGFHIRDDYKHAHRVPVHSGRRKNTPQTPALPLGRRSNLRPRSPHSPSRPPTGPCPVRLRLSWR